VIIKDVEGSLDELKVLYSKKLQIVIMIHKKWK